MKSFVHIQLITIRDPLEVESAKARRFVLIPTYRETQNVKRTKRYSNDVFHRRSLSHVMMITPTDRDEYRTRARTNSSFLCEVGPGRLQRVSGVSVRFPSQIFNERFTSNHELYETSQQTGLSDSLRGAEVSRAKHKCEPLTHYL